MTSHKSVVFVLLLLGTLSAFTASDYVYKNETNVSVSYTNFTLEGKQYSLVKFNSVDTFLLRDGEPLVMEGDIQSAVHEYYMSLYYPTDSEIQELKDLIERFNDSRNDGYDFKNKEEYICRDDILLSNGKVTVSGHPVRCIDDESCEENAMLLFSVYGEGLGLGSPTVILAPLKNFTPASLAMDSILANYTYKLDNMDTSNVADTITYIEDNADELKTYSLQVEKNLFRTPRLNDSADRAACTGKCWAICPSFDLDQNAADQIKEKAADLAEKIAPITNYEGISGTIYVNSQARLSYAGNESLADYYFELFGDVNSTGADVISLGQEAVAHVANATLTADLNRLRSMHSTIPEDIVARNFSNLDVDVAEYTALIGKVNSSAVLLLNEYNETRDAKNVADSTMLALETKEMDPASLVTFELLKNHTIDIDAQFRDGLTISQLQSLRANYTEVTSRAQELLKSETDLPATKALLLFRGFARRINTGIAAFATATQVMPAEDIPENPLLAFGGFSTLLFLSLASIALLVFLYLLVSVNFQLPRSRHVLLAAFVCSLVLLFCFSVFLFLFLNKTSTNATLNEFLADFDSRNSTSIVVDLRNASYADSQAMAECATSLADSITTKNKSWTMYTLTGTTCRETTSGGGGSNTTLSACLEDVENESSAFMLGYSATNAPPKFSIIYFNRAEIKANSDYYDSCPLVALFS